MLYDGAYLVQLYTINSHDAISKKPKDWGTYHATIIYWPDLWLE